MTARRIRDPVLATIIFMVDSTRVVLPTLVNYIYRKVAWNKGKYAMSKPVLSEKVIRLRVLKVCDALDKACDVGNGYDPSWATNEIRKLLGEKPGSVRGGWE